MNQLVVLLNLIGLFLFETLFMADVSIVQEVPARMEPGTEVRVTVEVDKGDLAGFAKLQLDLPDGLSASAIETKGASFTFADGKAKFIWMSLPASPTFRISYNLIASPDAAGPLIIQGRLSYIEDNERRTYEIAPSTVDLGQQVVSLQPEDAFVGEELVSAAGAAPLDDQVAPPSDDDEPDAHVPTEQVSELVIDAGMVHPNSQEVAVQSGGPVEAERTITPITEEEMLVEVVVKKGALRGFGKLQETIPAGFTALEKQSEDAIFTSQDRIVKFVWLNLPAKEELRVVYKLRGIGQPAGSYEVNGAFGYLLDDETRQQSVGTSSFRIGPDALKGLEELANDDSSLDTVALADPPLRSEKEEGQNGSTTTDKATGQAGVGRIPAPETGVTYKVQITAAHREVGAEYFRERHRFNGDFGIERHEGWIKYVTGRFNEYKAARDQREAYERAGHRFPGPFVTAYEQGRRITVQEALMISQQQWLP
ncbi:MAG: hypothetical protein KDC03_03340 [Flavobacteriales bacterium]|nr:hypothetical protein [Flavobacteriales bacterium]